MKTEILKSGELNREQAERRERAERLVQKMSAEAPDGVEISFDGQHILVRNNENHTTAYIPPWEKLPDGRSAEEHIRDAIKGNRVDRAS